MSLAPQEKTATQHPLQRLRALMETRGIDVFLVPLTDRFKSEYVPDCDKRLAFLTGFQGSAGFVLVGRKKATLFVDGRYTLEAKTTVDHTLFDLDDYTPTALAHGLKTHACPKGVVAFDPWLHSKNEQDWLAKICADDNLILRPTDNLVDAIWDDQPALPCGPMISHDVEYAGVSAGEKCAALAQDLKTHGVDKVALIATDSVAWLLNIRGSDVAFNPITLAYAFLNQDATVDLFVDPVKVTPACREALGASVRIHDLANLEEKLTRWARAGQKIQLDPNLTPYKMYDLLVSQGAKISFGVDPCALPKGCKNAVELAGAKAAHVRDGVAMVKFLHWLSLTVPQGHLTEIDAANRLEQFRQEDPLLRGNSFDTISGAGEHGAIIHYRVTEETNRPIRMDEIYLVDSGGQYLDGTTDVTRTLVFGTPTAEQKDRFTRVLKGHIALSSCRFPAGTTGPQIDTLARQALWQAGLDYAHGTGHGVGSYLNVHEGPHRIAKVQNTVTLEPGMIVSNEPGYYKEGAYGIRIENLVVVVPCAPIPGGELPMHTFENLTLVPIDRALIQVDLLTEGEIAWVNAYHADVCQKLLPHLNGDVACWLENATQPL